MWFAQVFTNFDELYTKNVGAPHSVGFNDHKSAHLKSLKGTVFVIKRNTDVLFQKKCPLKSQFSIYL